MSQDKGQNSSIFEVSDLDIGLQIAPHREGFSRRELNAHFLVGGHAVQIEEDVHLFAAVDAQRFGALVVHEGQRQNTHAHQIASMDPLEALRYHCLHTQQIRPFRCPVPTRPRTVLLSAENDRLLMVVLVPFCCIEDVQDFFGGEVDGLGSDLAVEHFVDDADIGEGASCHDEVVAPPRAVGVEILLFDALGFQEAGGGRSACDVAGGRDVVCRDGIAKHRQDVGVFDGLQLGQLLLDRLEEGRVVDVGGGFVPLEVEGLVDVEGVPAIGPLAELAVGVDVELGLDYRVLKVLDFLPRGPDVPQVHLVAVSVPGDGLALEVDVDCSRDGEGDHEGGRGQEVGFGHGVHSPFEISVSR